jgi:molybdate transport system substrate-binding protein
MRTGARLLTGLLTLPPLFLAAVLATLLATLQATLFAPSARAAEPLRIAVASNFKPTLERLNPLFRRDSGISVLLSGGATGVLATQIEHGAPFDLFFAADRDTPARLHAALSKPADALFCYATGTLVLAGAADLAALADPGLSLAIANPETAPYGRAALEVLARPGFAGGAVRKLVRGNNAAQVQQFWRSGAVDLALLPRALAPATAIPVPRAWHGPIAQYALVVRPGTAVDAYLAWLRSDTVRALILEAGYEPCP